MEGAAGTEALSDVCLGKGSESGARREEEQVAEPAGGCWRPYEDFVLGLNVNQG